MSLTTLYRQWRFRRLARRTAQAAGTYFGGLEAFVAERRAAEAEGRLDEWRAEKGLPPLPEQRPA